jgi:hypothetical protein
MFYLSLTLVFFVLFYMFQIYSAKCDSGKELEQNDIFLLGVDRFVYLYMLKKEVSDQT